MTIDCDACGRRGYIVAKFQDGSMQRRTCRRCKGARVIRLDHIAETILARCSKGDGCWEWRQCRTEKGYGQIRILGRGHRTHRLLWEAINGAVPSGMFVLHRCDNPPCCNPAHLFLGTAAENTADMMSKGRQKHGVSYRGERHWKAVLGPAQVREIRQLHAQGEVTFADLGRRFGIGEDHASRIVKRLAWRHISEDC